jgi:hypothetical protein
LVTLTSTSDSKRINRLWKNSHPNLLPLGEGITLPELQPEAECKLPLPLGED